MQSRRDCKADQRFDRIISLLYDNVQQYEEQVWPKVNLRPCRLILSRALGKHTIRYALQNEAECDRVVLGCLLQYGSVGKHLGPSQVLR